MGEAPAPSSYSSNYAVGSVNLITLTLNKGVYLILARGEVFTQNLRFGISISTTSATTDLNTRAIATAVTGQLANSQSTFRVVVISADNTPVYIVGQSYDGTVTASGWAQYIRIA